MDLYGFLKTLNILRVSSKPSFMDFENSIFTKQITFMSFKPITLYPKPSNKQTPNSFFLQILPLATILVF